MQKKEQFNKQETIYESQIGNIVVKKRITETISGDKKTIIQNSTTTSNENCKIQTNKDIKNRQKDQEQMMLNIENTNIQNHVQEILQKFNPPKCSKCDNRTADRVCVNKTCSRNNFMQLICGKCHSKEHQDSLDKPEIDLEEFFIKLTIFLNQQKYKKKASSQCVNDITKGLNQSLDYIKIIKQILNDLKEELKIEVKDYQRSEEMHSNLSNYIVKALNLSEYENVQNQLNFIKKSVLFNGNSFEWNGYFQKYKNINLLINKLEYKAQDISKSINKSLISNSSINLSNIRILKSDFMNYQSVKGLQAQLIDNEIYFKNHNFTNQTYLDLKLDYKCKYRMRFRFEQQINDYIAVGVTPLSNVDVWLSGSEYQFYKIFCNSITAMDSTRVLKGQNIYNIFKKGDQFEMRIDFQNYYMDFYDYPEMKNINANQVTDSILPNESFVLVVEISQSSAIVLESIEIIDEIDQIIPFQ